MPPGPVPTAIPIDLSAMRDLREAAPEALNTASAMASGTRSSPPTKSPRAVPPEGGPLQVVAVHVTFTAVLAAPVRNLPSGVSKPVKPQRAKPCDAPSCQLPRMPTSGVMTAELAQASLPHSSSGLVTQCVPQPVSPPAPLTPSTPPTRPSSPSSAAFADVTAVGGAAQSPCDMVDAWETEPFSPTAEEPAPLDVPVPVPVVDTAASSPPNTSMPMEAAAMARGKGAAGPSFTPAFAAVLGASCYPVQGTGEAVFTMFLDQCTASQVPGQCRHQLVGAPLGGSNAKKAGKFAGRHLESSKGGNEKVKEYSIGGCKLAGKIQDKFPVRGRCALPGCGVALQVWNSYGCGKCESELTRYHYDSRVAFFVC